MTSAGVVRCFLAFELAEASRDYLSGLLRPLRERLEAGPPVPARIVPPQNWHATVLFFQGLDESERGILWEEAVSGVSGGVWRNVAFDWQRIGALPGAKRPNILCLWASAYPAARAWPLMGKLERPPFDKADMRHGAQYLPHITMIRSKGRLRNQSWKALRELEADLPPVDPRRVQVDRISLFLSTVSRENPIYPRQHTLALKGE